MSAGGGASVGARIPAPLLFIVAALFQYVGAAIAIGLFAIMAPAGVVWWRIFIGALGMVLVWRPWRLRWSWASLGVALIFGVALGGMNLLFYEAIARIPLGATVSLEFTGPVVVAVFRGRGLLSRLSAAIAFAGVALIGGWGLDLSVPGATTGFLFGLSAGAAWAAYILLGAKISQSAPPGPSLALGTLMASVLFAPFLWESLGFGEGALGGLFQSFGGAPGTASGPTGVASGAVVAGSVVAGSAVASSGVEVAASGAAVATMAPVLVLLALIGVGLFSSTIPYSIEAVAFSRLSAAMFALLTALLPATSTLVGAVALGQIPSVGELVGLAMVSVAVWLASRSGDRPGKRDG